MVPYLKANLEAKFVFDFSNLARLPARAFFLCYSPKKKRFRFLLPASRICLMYRQDFFGYFFTQSLKILSKFSNLSAIWREKLCNDDVNRASVL